MSDVSAGFGELAEAVAGPPFLIGERGVPSDAPENTLAGFRLALAAGLDGIAYEVRACATGDPVVMRDERIDRTTDGRGALAELSLRELFHIDAGAWFGKAFIGEAIPLFDETLEVVSREVQPGTARRGPLHFVEVMHPGVLAEVIDRAAEYAERRSLRIASRSRSACVEARDAGLRSVWIGEVAGEEERRFVRDERLAGFATTARGWRTEAATNDWPCERWAIGVSATSDLLRMMRARTFGIVTDEPVRALATRALCHFAPHDGGDYPLQVPLLPVEPGGLAGPLSASSEASGSGSGEWAGAWAPLVRVRNPFPFDVSVGLGLRVRRGAFEFEGLPTRHELASGESADVAFRLVGGSWSPGGDPLVMAIFEWSSGPDRPGGKLLFEAPLERVRAVNLGRTARRLTMLAERPGEPEASMTIRAAGPSLLVSIENPGDLEEPHVLVHLDGHELRGGNGLRVPLPDGFADLRQGVDFSCAIEGWRDTDGERVRSVRRWAGGLPAGTGAGAPGLLVPAADG